MHGTKFGLAALGLLLAATVTAQTTITRVDSARSKNYGWSHLAGDRLYLWYTPDQMDLYDVGDPDRPIIVGTLDGGESGYFEPDPVPLENSLAYVVVGGTTHLFDFSDPASPSDLGAISPQLGSCAWGSSEERYDSTTQTLIHFCNPETPMPIQAFDLSDPLSPTLLWESDLPIPLDCYTGHAALRGDYLYATWTSFTHDPFTGEFTWYSNFGRFDYSDPENPSMLDSSVLSTGSSSGSHDLWIHDDTLFVLAGGYLRSYAFGAAGTITELDALLLPAQMFRGPDFGDVIFLHNNARIARVDLSSPSALQLQCDQLLVEFPDRITDVTSNGSELFVAKYRSGIGVYSADCTGPFAALGEVKTFTDPGQSVIVGDHAVARAYEALWSVGFDADGAIELLDWIPSDDSALFGLESGYALQRVGSQDLRVLDARDANALSEIGQVNLGFVFYDLESRGSLAAVRGSFSNHQGLYLIDFSDVLDPQIVGSLDLGSAYANTSLYRNMAFTEDAAYLGYGTQVLVVDLADPASPGFAQAFATGASAFPRFLLDVALGQLITSHYDLHQVWSLADPLNPTEIATLSPPQGDYYRWSNVGSLLIGTGSKVVAYDFHDPTAPQFLLSDLGAVGESDVLHIGSAMLTFSEPYGYFSYRVDSSVPAPAASPSRALLQQNHPNPFGSSTLIRLREPGSAPYRLQIYDAAGRRVRAWSGPRAPAEFHWDGRDHEGRPVASGVYFYQFTSGGHSEAKRMVLRR